MGQSLMIPDLFEIGKKSKVYLFQYLSPLEMAQRVFEFYEQAIKNQKELTYREVEEVIDMWAWAGYTMKAEEVLKFYIAKMDEKRPAKIFIITNVEEMKQEDGMAWKVRNAFERLWKPEHYSDLRGMEKVTTGTGTFVFCQYYLRYLAFRGDRISGFVKSLPEGYSTENLLITPAKKNIGAMIAEIIGRPRVYFVMCEKSQIRKLLPMLRRKKIDVEVVEFPEGIGEKYSEAVRELSAALKKMKEMYRKGYRGNVEKKIRKPSSLD